MKKKLLIRIGIIVGVVTILSFSDWSFAADNEPLRDTSHIINFLTHILSRIWVIFARFAGEFLTNKRVYGEVLGLDALLWKYRVVVRNVANFGLGVFFTYTIFMALFKKEDALKNFKNILLWLLVAGVGIQTSRFFTAVVMDVSTATLVSVGTFPSQVISKNSDLEKDFTKTLRDYLSGNVVLSGKQLTLFPKKGTSNSFLLVETKNIGQGDEITKEEFLDDLLPKYDSVSGPLYYMGIAILDSFNITNVPIDDTSDNGRKKTLLNTIIHGGTTIVYSIEMMVLCVVALLRVFYLWMFIALSPLAVLIYCIKKADSNSIGKLLNSESLKDLTDNLNFESFFINAFKPTIIVLGISLSIVFVAAMKGVIMKANTINFQGVSLTSHCPQNSPSIKCDTSVDGELFAGIFKNLSKTFMDIILSIITVILVYQIIKIGVGIGKGNDFVSKKIKGLQDNIGSVITSTPIIPIGSKDENGKRRSISIGSAFGIGDKKGVIEQKIDYTKYDFEGKTNNQTTEVVNAILGESSSNTLTAAEEGRIRTAGRPAGFRGLQKLDEKKKVIEEIRTEKGKGMKLNPSAPNQFWREEFTFWLNDTNPGDITGGSIKANTWRDMVKTWQKEPDKSKRDLRTLFQNKSYAQAYAEYFGYTGNYNSFDDIQNLDVSQNPPSQTPTQ